jgi:hypothetical protein
MWEVEPGLKGVPLISIDPYEPEPVELADRIRVTFDYG